MNIELYTIPDCTWCIKAEKLLKMANVTEYKKYIVGENGVTYDYVRRKFPLSSGYPIILVDQKIISGIIDLAKILIQNGLISSNKNESGFTDK